MEEYRVAYNRAGVIALSVLVSVCGIAAPLLIESICIRAIATGRGQTGIYAVMGALLLVVFLVSPAIYTTLKSLFGMLQGKPAVELKTGGYTDHINGVILSWPEISAVYLLTRKQSLLSIAVFDNAAVFSQSRNPVMKWLFLNNAFGKGAILKTNLMLLAGRNQQIVDLIKQYHLKMISLALE